jgi:ABC-type amino acid transport substrate-binding protein
MNSPKKAEPKKWNRTRVTFFGVIGIAAALLASSAFLTNRGAQPSANDTGSLKFAENTKSPVTVIAPTATQIKIPASQPTEAPTLAPKPTQPPVSTAPDEFAKPIFAPDADLKDGLPTYVCGSLANGSYYIPQLIQAAKLDRQNGFHLGIIPIDLNDNYAITEPEVAAKLRKGEIDCMVTTLDSVALNDSGAITAIVDESAGTDSLWARNVNTLNDLKGKRIAYEKDGSSEFLVRIFLAAIQLDPDKDVKMEPYDLLGDAIADFNDGKADAISGWEPDVLETAKGGGKLLASTKNFRFIVDVIATSRDTIAKRNDVAKKFHEAWFAALDLQSRDFEGAAKLLASWGNNDWTGVSIENAAEDWRVMLNTIAQADFRHNTSVFEKPNLLIDRLNDARRVWKIGGKNVPESVVTLNVDSLFITHVTDQYKAKGKTGVYTFPNNTFSIGQSAIAVADNAAPEPTTAPELPAATATTAPQNTPTPESVPTDQTVAVLPCKRFEFIPDTTKLTIESQKEVNDCVLPFLQASVGTYLRVVGSAAWPGPKGAYKQDQISAFAESRANSIVEFLVLKGIDKGRFVVESQLPPRDHWETTDLRKQAEDRFVEMTLLISGR